MFMNLMVLAFCLISTCIIVDFILFDDRERLTQLICAFCFVSTYLIIDFMTFDYKKRIVDQIITESIKANISAENNYLSSII